jgi:hypothetical protein
MVATEDAVIALIDKKENIAYPLMCYTSMWNKKIGSSFTIKISWIDHEPSLQ